MRKNLLPALLQNISIIISFSNLLLYVDYWPLNISIYSIISNWEKKMRIFLTLHRTTTTTTAPNFPFFQLFSALTDWNARSSCPVKSGSLLRTDSDKFIWLGHCNFGAKIRQGLQFFGGRWWRGGEGKERGWGKRRGGGLTEKKYGGVIWEPGYGTQLTWVKDRRCAQSGRKA